SVLALIIIALFVCTRDCAYPKEDCGSTAATSHESRVIAPPSDLRLSDFGILGVPWCRSKHGATVEWTSEDLIQGLQEFVPIYQTRPINNNKHGMLFDHSFGLWFMAKWLKPVVIIENGAFKGHSTWILRQAVPNARILTFTPEHPRNFLKKGQDAYVDPNGTYFSDEEFVDFGSVDWNEMLGKYGIQDRSRILVFFDEHQNQLKRLKQALKGGFNHLIFEDNYDTGGGDHYTFRQICDQSYIRGGGHSCYGDSDEARERSYRKENVWKGTLSTGQLCSGDAWWGNRGEMLDDFHRKSQPMNYTEHFDNGRFAESVLDVYWELPPVAAPWLTNQTRYDPARTSHPVVKDGELFEKVGLGKLEGWLFNGYTQMVYVKIS
ncbi:hypothetical protein M569_04595, partial [Genlisea aurea]